MSGITGALNLDGRPLEREDMARMVQSIAHRGPDGSGVWTEGSAGLGHRMLWTTPESLNEKLPLADRARNMAITADARIDNRAELIDALDIRGQREEISDSELILLAYQRWGERCPERLEGDFAFAIWDGANQLLFCARDHMGVKPFYYHRSGQAFAFASEIKALFALPDMSPRINESRLADYLVNLISDDQTTFYEDVLRLPPAHCLTVRESGTKLRSYWALDPTKELKLGSDQEYADAYRELFTEAVRCRLRSAFPSGSMLSGGLDSSSIVCVARELKNGDGNLHTFSAIFDELPQCDERTYINAVLAGGDLQPHYLHADQISPLTDFDRALWHQDEPIQAPNMFIHWGLHESAQKHGVRVLLDGLLGDGTVSYGLGRIAELAGSGRLLALATEVRQLSKFLNSSPPRLLWGLGIKPWIPENARRIWRRLRRRNGNSWIEGTIIDPDFARRTDLAERFLPHQIEASRNERSARDEHWRNMTDSVIPYALEAVDRVAAASSVDARYPYLDRRLLEFCLSLPADQKLEGGWNRIIARRALAGTLPEEVRWRGGKGNVLANLIRGLRTVDVSLLETAASDDHGPLQEYVDGAALSRTYRRFVSDPNDGDGTTLLRATILARWLNRPAVNGPDGPPSRVATPEGAGT